jgi:hypothetical protein
MTQPLLEDLSASEAMERESGLSSEVCELAVPSRQANHNIETANAYGAQRRGYSASLPTRPLR